MKDNEILVRKVYDLTKIEEAHIFKNTGIGIVEERGMEIDGIFVCPEGEANINLIVNSLRNKAIVVWIHKMLKMPFWAS